MDALQLLRDDHRKVRDLFRQFDEADDASTRKAIVDEAVAELMIHAQLEEEIFYPAMAREGMKDLIDHAEEEHTAAENIMNDLIGINALDSALEVKFKVLIEVVTEHVTEEESAIFPRAAEIGMARLEKIGDKLQEMRNQILTTPEPQRRKPRAHKTIGTRAARGTGGSRATATTKTATRARKTGTTAAARTTKTAAKKTMASTGTTAAAPGNTATAAGKTIARVTKTAATTARKTATRAAFATRAAAKPTTKTNTRKAGGTRAKATTARKS